VQVTYNPLNLPESVTDNSNPAIKIFYHYDATGRKLAKTNETSNSSVDNTTDYVGNIIYENDEIAYIITSEGRMVPIADGENTRWHYEYFVKDHLGNTRVTFGGSMLAGKVDMVQQSHYYPFGLVFSETNYQNTLANYTKNKYLYNGKELQDDQLAGRSLNWYDYGARFYMADLGRFTTPDIMAGFHPGITPYSISYNNPVLYIDYYGLGPIHDFLQSVITSVVRVFGFDTKGKILPKSSGGGNFVIYKNPRAKSASSNKASVPSGEPKHTAQTTKRLESNVTTPDINLPLSSIASFDFEDRVQVPDISIDIPVSGHNISFDKMINFKVDSNNPVSNQEFNENLQELLIVMNAEPKLMLEIIAHAGSDYPGQEKYYGESDAALGQAAICNKKITTVKGLMSERALAVYSFLKNNGINPNRMKISAGRLYETPTGRKVTFKLINP
jgi:RHS repeat-associated protein